jgi:rhodanese-related sulfurtransferase
VKFPIRSAVQVLNRSACSAEEVSVKHNPGFLELVRQAKQKIKECSVGDVKAKLDRGESFHFIDIREDHEYQVDHAKGAVHLGKGILERDIESVVPNKDETIILYCGGGFRSALAADSLQQMGYRNVISMDGGIRAWREAGLPVEKNSGT